MRSVGAIPTKVSGGRAALPRTAVITPIRFIDLVTSEPSQALRLIADRSHD
jgi:hypothetical protein